MPGAPEASKSLPESESAVVDAFWSDVVPSTVSVPVAVRFVAVALPVIHASPTTESVLNGEEVPTPKFEPVERYVLAPEFVK